MDFDDSRMGPAVQDLWMLLLGERADRVRQLSDVLAGYEDFCDFDERERHLIEALRTSATIYLAHSQYLRSMDQILVANTMEYRYIVKQNLTIAIL